MTRKEIEERIEELEHKRFNLAMCDFWTNDDRETDRKWMVELLRLKAMLENEG